MFLLLIVAPIDVSLADCRIFFAQYSSSEPIVYDPRADAANDCLYCLVNLHLWSKETAAPMICRTRHAPPVPNDWRRCCVATDGTLTAVAQLLLMALLCGGEKEREE